jgi:hypothetical protein
VAMRWVLAKMLRSYTVYNAAWVPDLESIVTPDRRSGSFCIIEREGKSTMHLPFQSTLSECHVQHTVGTFYNALQVLLVIKGLFTKDTRGGNESKV